MLVPVGVTVGVSVTVGVLVTVGVFVTVGLAVAVGVLVGVLDDVGHDANLNEASRVLQSNEAVVM